MLSMSSWVALNAIPGTRLKSSTALPKYLSGMKYSASPEYTPLMS